MDNQTAQTRQLGEPPTPTVLKVYLALNGDKKILGIKWLREAFAIGLKEAKDAWEAIFANGYALIQPEALYQFYLVDQERQRRWDDDESWVLQLNSVERVPMPEYAEGRTVAPIETGTVRIPFYNGWSVALSHYPTPSWNGNPGIRVLIYNPSGVLQEETTAYGGEVALLLQKTEQKRDVRHCDLTAFTPVALKAAA